MRHFCGFCAGVAVAAATNLATALDKQHISVFSILEIILFFAAGALLYVAAVAAEKSERAANSFYESSDAHRMDYAVPWWVLFGAAACLTALGLHIYMITH